LFSFSEAYCLPGTRVLVYWPNSSVQWNSAVITGSDSEGMLQVMFDEVSLCSIVS